MALESRKYHHFVFILPSQYILCYNSGTGLASVIMSFLFVGYFSAMCGYVLYYVGASLSLSGLPWASCNHHWATSNCFDGSEDRSLSILLKTGLS